MHKSQKRTERKTIRERERERTKENCYCVPVLFVSVQLYLCSDADRAPEPPRVEPVQEDQRRSGNGRGIVLESIVGRQQKPGTGTEQQW